MADIHFPSQDGEVATFTLKPGLEQAWAKQVETNNEDSYSRRCVTYAADWAWLMEQEIARRELIPGENPSEEEVKAYKEGVLKMIIDFADKAGRETDYDGITGFMYGAAVSMLAQAWVHGDELRRWHNKQYGVEDSTGTVNPAILTIKSS